ncbi:MAG: V-type ATPase subunit [Spirochaetota bacterium]|nr:MAG: V-type ATPase subunit [Spirochaetota bacterium]
MLTYNPQFREDPEYAYAVARIRALETKLIEPGAFSSLIGTPIERFGTYFHELTGIEGASSDDLHLLVNSLEKRFTNTFFLVKSLLLDEGISRLISLKYDYELLKLVLKEQRGKDIEPPESFMDRSRYSYEDLKAMLEAGKVIDLGPVMSNVYAVVSEAKQITGREIDYRCDLAYYEEVFEIIESLDNDFIQNFFLREIDAQNIMGGVRLKLLGGKRSQLRERYIPFGTIDLGYLEQILDLSLEGFAQKIVFSPLAGVLLKVNKGSPEEEQITQLERLIDEDMLMFLRETIFVTFGVEPVLAYLWMNEVELRNLRTVLIAKHAGVSASEMKFHIRGVYG